MKKYLFAFGVLALISFSVIKSGLIAQNPNVTVYKFINDIQVFPTPGIAKVHYSFIGNDTAGSGVIDIPLKDFDISLMDDAIKGQIGLKKSWSVDLVSVK